MMLQKFWHSSNQLDPFNYFDDPIKLFSDLYLVKFLDTLAKRFLSV